MPDQHPLTDAVCYEIGWNTQADYQDETDLMRAAADWQLEQVIEWLRNNLDESYTIIALRKEMRPTNTQENN